MKQIRYIFSRLICVLFTVILGSSTVFGATVNWVSESGDFLATVGGYDVLEYKNAGTDGFDWTVTGSGADGGNGSSQLWLLNPPNTAFVTFTVASRAVSFMMNGDSNDGFAKFMVDGIDMGTFDMFNRPNQSLIVSGLDMGVHTISVVQVGQKNPASSNDDVAIYGGAAVTPVPLPGAVWLLFSGLLMLAGLDSTRKRM